MPLLYAALDLRGDEFCRLEMHHIATLARYANNQIKSLVIDRCSPFFSRANDERRITELRAFFNLPLESFEFYTSQRREPPYFIYMPSFPPPQLRRLHLDEETSLHTISVLLGRARNLEYLSFRVGRGILGELGPYPSLKILKVSLPEGDILLTSYFLRYLPNVEELTLRLIDVHKLDDNDDIYEKTDFDFTHTLQSLKWLKIETDYCRPLNSLVIDTTSLRSLEMSDIGAPHQVLRLNGELHLQRLVLGCTCRHARDIVRLFRPTASTLEEFSLASCYLDKSDVEYFISHARGLKSFNISNIQNVNDSTLELLCTHRELESFDITHCPDVTGAGIIRLVEALSPKRGGKLKAIKAHHNQFIRDQTIHWAKEMGVAVDVHVM
jgi:hypothetical protein